MDIRGREQGCNFGQYVTEKLVSLFLCGIKRKIFPTPFTAGRDFRIRTTRRTGMSRHVDFRNHHDVAIGSIPDHFTNLLLRIELRCSGRIFPYAPCTDRGQFRITFDLDTPTRLVGQMPMKDVQFQFGHPVKHLKHFLFTEEMTGFVQHKPAPSHPGGIFNPACGESAVIVPNQLQQRLFPVKKSRQRRCRHCNSIRCHNERISFTGNRYRRIKNQIDRAFFTSRRGPKLFQFIAYLGYKSGVFHSLCLDPHSRCAHENALAETHLPRSRENGQLLLQNRLVLRRNSRIQGESRKYREQACNRAGNSEHKQ